MTNCQAHTASGSKETIAITCRQEPGAALKAAQKEAGKVLKRKSSTFHENGLVVSYVLSDPKNSQEVFVLKCIFVLFN